MDFARAIGVRRIGVVALDEHGRYIILSWGATENDCRAAAKWAEGTGARRAVSALAQKPCSRLPGGFTHAALLPVGGVR
jgi:hypothetical protein